MNRGLQSRLRIPDIGDCVYTECYCEENIWKLCEFIKLQQTDQLTNCFVVFVSNDIQKTPLFRSKFREFGDGFILWDYHVFLVYITEEGEPLVYDFDTRNAFPCPLSEYVLLALGSEEHISEKYHRMFRVIAGEEYLTKFSSDRNHMRKADGSWIKDPPSYPCIVSNDGKNLDDFISMDTKRCDVGNVVNFQAFQRLFLKNVLC